MFQLNQMDCFQDKNIKRIMHTAISETEMDYNKLVSALLCYYSAKLFLITVFIRKTGSRVYYFITEPVSAKLV